MAERNHQPFLKAAFAVTQTNLQERDREAGTASRASFSPAKFALEEVWVAHFVGACRFDMGESDLR